MPQVTYFEVEGATNTETCLDLARRRADELGIETILVASTRGRTALAAGPVFAGKKLIIVSHSTGFRGPDIQTFPEEIRHKLVERGIPVLTTTHAFGGIGRAIRRKFNTYQIDEIIANTLKVFGQGTKVACETTMMAADAGLIRTDRDVIAIAGSSEGADTALVLKPANSQDFFDLKVREVICKPRL